MASMEAGVTKRCTQDGGGMHFDLQTTAKENWNVITKSEPHCQLSDGFPLLPVSLCVQKKKRKSVAVERRADDYENNRTNQNERFPSFHPFILLLLLFGFADP